MRKKISGSKGELKLYRFTYSELKRVIVSCVISGFSLGVLVGIGLVALSEL